MPYPIAFNDIRRPGMGGKGLYDALVPLAPRRLPMPFEGGYRRPLPQPGGLQPMPFEGDFDPRALAGKGGGLRFAEFMRRMQALRQADMMRRQLTPRPY